MGKGKTDIERAAAHFGVPESEVTVEMVQHIRGIPRGNGLQSGGFTRADIEEAAVKAAELTGAKLLKEFAKEEGNPISAKCERVLSSPVKCWDFRGTRRYAACAAWQAMEEEHIGWAEAIKRGWSKVRGVCEWRE